MKEKEKEKNPVVVVCFDRLPSEFPAELQLAIKTGIELAEELSGKVATSNPDELAAFCKGALKKLAEVMPNTGKRKDLIRIFNLPTGLAGILYPSLLEEGGEFYPGSSVSIILSRSRFW